MLVIQNDLCDDDIVLGVLSHPALPWSQISFICYESIVSRGMVNIRGKDWLETKHPLAFSCE